MNKIRIFLGGYVNYPNAQNINCDNIAKKLDKKKFEVHVMYTDKMPIDKAKYKADGIHIHRLFHHRFIWYWCKYLTMLFGNYDIYYLPKAEGVDAAFARRHNDRVFIASVEGVVGEQIQRDNQFIRHYYNDLMTDYFSISKCINDSVNRFWGKNTSILHLGLNVQKISPRKREAIKTIIWIGSVIERKRPKWFLECAKAFPNLSFVMIGDGNQQDEIHELIQTQHIGNVVLRGRIQNESVYEELRESDLLLMTSDREGLPKVIGEAMITGVPVIYVNKHYMVDYIENGVNGFGVSGLEEMIEKINYLLERPDVFQKLCKNAYRTIQDYTWDKLIKNYDEYFIDQYVKHGKTERGGR